MTAALTATVFVMIVGIPLGYLLAKARFPGRTLIEAVLTLPLALPPTVMAYYLLVQLGGPGPVRDTSIKLFGHPLVFTWWGIVVAQAVEAMPFCVRATRASIEGVDARVEQSARALGLAEWRIALRVTLPLARRGIVAGIAMAFGRALGDYAATATVSGLLPGTSTMSVILFHRVIEEGGHGARQLAVVQLVVAVAILVGVGYLGKTRDVTPRSETARPKRELEPSA